MQARKHKKQTDNCSRKLTAEEYKHASWALTMCTSWSFLDTSVSLHDIECRGSESETLICEIHTSWCAFSVQEIAGEGEAFVTVCTVIQCSLAVIKEVSQGDSDGEQLVLESTEWTDVNSSFSSLIILKLLHVTSEEKLIRYDESTKIFLKILTLVNYTRVP